MSKGTDVHSHGLSFYQKPMILDRRKPDGNKGIITTDIHKVDPCPMDTVKNVEENQFSQDKEDYRDRTMLFPGPALAANGRYSYTKVLYRTIFL